MQANLFYKTYNKVQKHSFLKKLKRFYILLDKLIRLACPKPKPIGSTKKQVLILYNLALGDGVIFKCSSDDYLKVFPKDKYEISLICQKGLEALYKNDDTFTRIVPVDFNKATINIKERISVIRILRKYHYDILIDPIGVLEFSTNVVMSKNASADKKFGFIDENKTCFVPEKYIKRNYTKVYKIKEKTILSLVDLYQKEINLLGNLKENTKLVPTKTEKPKIKIPNNYFIIFPSASIELKRWPIENFRNIAKKVYEVYKIPLLVCGTNVDKEIVEDLVNDLNIKIYNYINKTNLNDYFELIKNAKFVITNDTSAYHLAVVNQTPVIITTGCYNYDRYITYDFKEKNNYRRPYIASVATECKNCNDNCKYLSNNDVTYKCLKAVKVKQVWDLVKELMHNEYNQ